MTNKLLLRAAVAAALVLVSAIGASAQMSEAIGIRAQGMSGAFTAVADDATATWWNPAGLASGAYFNTVVETGRQRQPTNESAVPASETINRGFSLAYPALGLSYYRLQISEIQPVASTGGGTPGRQDEGSRDIRLQRLVLSQFGATVGQSMGSHLVLASTLKLVRGSLATEVRPAIAASIDAAEELEGPSETHAALDIGALARVGRLRLGLMVRNATETTFFGDDDRGTGLTLDRRFRAGVALGSHSNLTMLAADFDLTRSLTATGEQQRAAVGVEGWSVSRRIGLRGGASVNMLDTDRIVVSGGASVAVRKGTYVDVAGALGSDDSQSGWGFALRVTF